MANNYFEFKQFTVYQSDTAMKVGTDGVLLGAWAECSGHRILDIGTGTGLLALMMAQRLQQAEITGIEIDEKAAGEAKRNIEASKWHNRIIILHTSLQEFAKDEGNRSKFDRIISNPPYFSRSEPSPDAARGTARHTDSLSYAELMVSAAGLLTEEGVISVIYPADRNTEMMAEATRQSLFCRRRAEVASREGNPPIRIMAEFSRYPGDTIVEKIAIHSSDSAGYSERYATLARDFYLNV